MRPKSPLQAGKGPLLAQKGHDFKEARGLQAPGEGGPEGLGHLAQLEAPLGGEVPEKGLEGGLAPVLLGLQEGKELLEDGKALLQLGPGLLGEGVVLDRKSVV